MLIESQYLPTIPYLIALKNQNSITLEAYENFGKQSFRNRTQILTAQGVLNLVVPVKQANSKIQSKDILIDYTQKWQQVHLRAIRSSYGKSPFYEHYFPMIEKIILKNHIKLWELNFELLNVIIKWFKLDISVCISDKYIKDVLPDDLDLRNVIHPKKTIKDHLFFKNYTPQIYNQAFGDNFFADLSVLDLLMNEGPYAISILNNSALSCR